MRLVPAGGVVRRAGVALVASVALLVACSTVLSVSSSSPADVEHVQGHELHAGDDLPDAVIPVAPVLLLVAVGIAVIAGAPLPFRPGIVPRTRGRSPPVRSSI